MKSILILTACFAALAVPTTSFAAKGDKANRPGKVIRQYDTDKNGKIEGAEVEGFRKAFEADKTGPLKKFDTDSDGSLSDSEIAAVKGRAKGEKKKKKNV